jgi:chromosome partitioning protein
MTGLRLALANLKPGTGKTTSAVWLAHVFAQAGNSVLLVDADPSGSALEWSDLAAMYPRLSLSQAAFPFRIVALPSRELHRRVPEIARADDVVIIDTPQLEDHASIARSAMRYADEILIPCGPTPIEINRTTPVREEITDLGSVRDKPLRSSILLNRCITRAHSTTDAREVLEGLGYDVLGTSVPRLEVYAQSFGVPIRHHGLDIWRNVAQDLVERCLPRCTIRSLAHCDRPATAASPRYWRRRAGDGRYRLLALGKVLHPAAVGGQGGAAEVGGVGRDKEGDRRGDLLRFG